MVFAADVTHKIIACSEGQTITEFSKYIPTQKTLTKCQCSISISIQNAIAGICDRVLLSVRAVTERLSCRLIQLRIPAQE